MTGALTRGALCSRQCRSTSDSDSGSDSDGEDGGAHEPRKILSRKRVDTSSRAFTMFREPLATSSSPSVSATSSSSERAKANRNSLPVAPRSRLANLASELVVMYGPPSLHQMTRLLSRGLGIAEEAMSVAVESTTSMVRRSSNGNCSNAPEGLEIEMRTSAERSAEKSAIRTCGGGSDRAGGSGYETKTSVDRAVGSGKQRA
jgi:hypothetical protein